MHDHAVKLERVSRSYGTGDRRVDAIRDIDLEIGVEEIVVLTGPSGSGKSTILHIAGAMDRPTSGRVTIAGRESSELTDGELTALRRSSIGFVFQFFNLVPTLTVEENVRLPLLLNGRGEDRDRISSLLERLGIDHRRGHYPWQLSGGEMQRTAIARALVHEPSVVIADEPTGNLDAASGAAVLETLTNIHEETRIPVLMATHSTEAAAIGTRRIRVVDGRLTESD